MRLGIQLHAWRTTQEILEFAELAQRSFHQFWVTDQMLARHHLVLLAAVGARTGMGVGTCVSHPFGHNPVELAAAYATLGEVVSPEAPLSLGIGTGGLLLNSLFERKKSVGRTREFVQVVRKLLRGESVPLGDYPRVVAQCGFRPDALAQLGFPVNRSIPVLITGSGPQILRATGEVADGVICASNLASHSLGAFRAGSFQEVSNLDALAEGLRNSEPRPFRRVYGINVSIAADRDVAKNFAKRHAALSLDQPDENLARIGVDPALIHPVRQAFKAGLGVEGAAKFVPQEAADAVIISGTPADCVPLIQEVIQHATRAGFEEFYIGAPLGPNPVDAVQLLTEYVVPAIQHHQS